MRKLTNFQGWQSDVDYLASEAERQAKIEATVALYKREEKRPLKRARLWQLGVLCLLLVVLFGYWAMRLAGLL